jgi:hypothetical protein
MLKLENALKLIDEHNPNERLYLGFKIGRYPIRQRSNKAYVRNFKRLMGFLKIVFNFKEIFDKFEDSIQV